MAFNPGNTAPVAATTNDSWKAQAFLNIYIPKKGVEGGRIKVGAIPLKSAKKFDASVIERLSSGGPEALQAFAAVVEWDFNLVDDSKPADLPF